MDVTDISNLKTRDNSKVAKNQDVVSVENLLPSF